MKMNNKNLSDLFATFFNQVWRLISGPLLLLLIPLYLTETQQGYWYLFGSIAALSTFADLGFSNIILQFSAHEFASLSFDEKGKLIGDEQRIKKSGSFFRFVVGWLSKMCSIVFPIIFVVGIFFFVRDGVFTEYIVPWCIYTVGSLINFFNNSILSYIEGMDQITKIQQSRLIVAVINTGVVVAGLLLRWNIYALSCAMICSASFMFITIFKTFGVVISQVWKESHNFEYPWKKEILPLFKKYVLSFASGYFIFQVYTPLMHLFHGPIYGGKVGISLTLVNAMFSFASIWMYTVTPRLNMMIAQRDWIRLDKLFNKRMFFCLGTYIFIVISFITFVFLFGRFEIIGKIISRFLPVSGLAILIFSYFLQVFINNWAIYLRGHKMEPYWHTSILSAIWVLVVTLIAGMFLSPDYFFVGLLSSYIWGLPWTYLIYKRNKRVLHCE